MKAKLRGTTGAYFDVEEVNAIHVKDPLPFVRYYADEEGTIYKETVLEFLHEESKEVTIEGWVARDESGCLFLHYWEPHRTPGGDKWYSEFAQKCLPKDSFPEVTWDTEPKRVKITITPY